MSSPSIQFERRVPDRTSLYSHVERGVAEIDRLTKHFGYVQQNAANAVLGGGGCGQARAHICVHGRKNSAGIAALKWKP